MVDPLPEAFDCPACGQPIRTLDLTDVRRHLAVHRVQKMLGLPFSPPIVPPAEEQMLRETVGSDIPAGVLVAERMGSTFVMDDFALARAGASPSQMEAVIRDRLTHELQQYAGGFGFDVHPESIWFERIEEVGAEMRQRVTAEWCPDPMKGCEFRGGPVDGTWLALRREHSGRPQRYWLVDVMEPVSWPQMTGKSQPPPIGLQHARYERAGIDSMRDCWVYEFRSLG